MSNIHTSPHCSTLNKEATDDPEVYQAACALMQLAAEASTLATKASLGHSDVHGHEEGQDETESEKGGNLPTVEETKAPVVQKRKRGKKESGGARVKKGSGAAKGKKKRKTSTPMSAPVIPAAPKPPVVTRVGRMVNPKLFRDCVVFA